MIEKESKYVKKSGNSGVQLVQFIEIEGNTVNDSKSEVKLEQLINKWMTQRFDV